MPVTLAPIRNSSSSLPPIWVNRAIAAGLQRLTVLSLDGTPARDVISMTAAVWGQCIGSGRLLDEQRDAPRFEAAFETLCRTCRRWPAPADFIQALPPCPPDRPAPGPPRVENPAAKARIEAIIKGIARGFAVRPPAETADPAPHNEAE